jgi:hypothetical protein
VSAGQLYSAVRFRIDDPRWTAHLAGSQNHIVPDDGSVLRVVASEADRDKGVWLVYESAEPCPVRYMDSRVLAGCRALARLALDRPVQVRTIEVRISQDGGWLPLRSRAHCAPDAGYGESLLPSAELTVESSRNGSRSTADSTVSRRRSTGSARALFNHRFLPARPLSRACTVACRTSSPSFPRHPAAGAAASRKPPTKLPPSGRGREGDGP